MELFRVLHEVCVPYLLVGGVAMLTYVEGRNTKDVDLLMSVTAMEQIPETLLARLEPAGILVAPVGPHQGVQTLIRVSKTDAGFDRKALVDVRFVPALPGIAREL